MAAATHDSFYDMMYENALLSLAAGHPLPCDQEILSFSPLPNNLTEPYAAQEADIRQTMTMAYKAMAVWVEEAKKANYFSKRFVQLSKLVMKGVTTMGRGLVSLHNRGETLDEVPMSITDLIGVASYHFRKSYLGVLQTARSHPEISERLLVNQLAWTNMLLRLYKTREKLEKPAVLPQNTDTAEQLPEENKAANIGTSANGKKTLPGRRECGFNDIAAFFEPASFSAPHALSSLDGSREPVRSGKQKKSESGSRNLPGASETSDQVRKIRPAAETETADKTARKASQNDENLKEREPDPEELNGNKPEISEEPGNTENTPPVLDLQNDSETSHSDPEKGENKDSETDPKASAEPERPRTDFSSPEEIRSVQPPDTPPDTGPYRPPGPGTGGGFGPDPWDVPEYIEILQNVYQRSAGSEGNTTVFTYDDLERLVSDPIFRRMEPDLAADIDRLWAISRRATE